MFVEGSEDQSSGQARFLIGRGLVVAICLLLALASWRLLARRQSGQEEILDFAMRSGRAVPRDQLDRFLTPEPDLTRARLRVARTVLEEQRDLRWISDLPDAERPQARRDSLQLLLDSRDQAALVLAERPASWEAMLIVGATSYVHTLRDSPMRLVSTMEEWERPLLEARSIGPGAGQASRYIAMGYVDVWLSLSGEKKEDALPILRQAMTDLTTFDRLIDTWMRLVHDRQTALSVVPEQPAQWQRLLSIFEARKDWRGYVDARDRWREAYLADTHRQLDEAAERARGGDLQRAGHRYRMIAGRLRPSAFQLELLDRVLREAPPGALTSMSGESLGLWMEWCLELCFLGRCPLEESLLGRLMVNTGPLHAPRRAFAELMAGDGPKARRAEAESIEAWSEEWGQFQILNAKDLVEAGALERAHDALLRVSAEWQETVPYWQAKARLAEAGNDVASASLAARQLDARSRSRWQAEAWSSPSRRQWHLPLFPSMAGTELLVAIDEAPAEGAVVELEWDGRHLSTLVVGPRTEFRVPVEVTTEIHRLSLSQLSIEGTVLPGTVSLSRAGAPTEPPGG